jgi:hypothetical protein
MAAQLQALASGNATTQADLGSGAVRIRQTLIRLATLVEDAARERRAGFTEVPDGGRLLRTLRRSRHDIDMLRRAAREGRSDVLNEPAAQSWRRAAESGAAILSTIGRIFGIGFALEQLRRDLDDLTEVSREIAHRCSRSA